MSDGVLAIPFVRRRTDSGLEDCATCALVRRHEREPRRHRQRALRITRLTQERCFSDLRSVPARGITPLRPGGI